MRRWTIGIMVVLLLAACHRHREKAAPDTAEMTNLRILARKRRTIYSSSLMVGEWQRETLHELSVVRRRCRVL